MNKWGHLRVKHLLENEGPVFPASTALDKGLLLFQYSSFSGSDQKFLQELRDSFLSGTTENSKPLGRSEMQLVWPTGEEVRNCVEGYWSGASMPSTAANCNKVPCEMIRAWGSPHSNAAPAIAARRTVMPHIKSLVRISRDSSTVAWNCLTSCNLSKAAWGTKQKNGKQFFCRHWELGILFTPVTLGRKPDQFSCDLPSLVGMCDVIEPSDQPLELCTLVAPTGPASACGATVEGSAGEGCVPSLRQKALMPLPYELPAPAYPEEMRPWRMGLQFWPAEPWHCNVDRPQRPDKFGRTDCQSAIIYGHACAE